MKFCILLFLFVNFSVFAQKNSDFSKAFIKGNIAEKVNAVTTSPPTEKAKIASMGLEFCIQNAQILKGDEDLAQLSFSSVSALGEKSVRENVDKLLSVFALFPQEQVRTCVLEKMSSCVSDDFVKQKTVSLLNLCFDENIFFGAKCFSVIKKTENQEFLPQIAENALNRIIKYLDETKDNFDERVWDLESEVLSVIAKSKWTKAAALVAANFSLLTKYLFDFKISEDKFCALLEYSAQIPSYEIAISINDCLGLFNGRKEKKSPVPSERVLLAVIDALGETGEKSAFDNLLFATYLSYSQKVVSAAQDALSKLRW